MIWTKFKTFITMYLILLTEANEALKLNEISVPQYHVLEHSNQLLLLKCDYSVDDDESGFVLKWYFNSVPIYQWIPPRTPHVLSSFKGRIDSSYFSSNDFYTKHSSLLITNPTAYDTGNYSCIVQTFQGYDEKTAPLIIIDPDNSMNLNVRTDEAERQVYIECSILKFYDISKVGMTITTNGRDSSISLDKYELEKINKYTAKMNIEDLGDQSTFTCLASFNEIDYELKKAITYGEMKSSFNPEKIVRLFAVLLHSYDRFIKFYFS